MFDATARRMRMPWLTALALAFALVLLAPWHAAGAASRSLADFAIPTGPEHPTGCPVFASRAQAAPAQARKAAPAQPETAAASALHDRAGCITDSVVQPGVASRAAPVSPLPLYLVTLRLRR